ncbi:MAG TPA: DUF72 domain-containing protein [Rhodothermales bacterium]|nr:DUF72 domain-containing protein [Rhodothermales bacterium]
MALYTGTSGFSYKEWKGVFYPEKLPDSEMLAYYSGQLPAVEINNTFYRLPRPDVLAGWAAQVPESFRFILKASRRITHFKKLKDAADVTEYMFSVASGLGSRLGPILFQLPPNFPKDVERLTAFLELIPIGVRGAFEFRHDSWNDPDVHQALAHKNAAWCVADADDQPAVMVRTADWGYLRLRREGYTDAELESWAGWIGEQGWEDAFVFFKHEDAGAGPKMASQFLSMLEK